MSFLIDRYPGIETDAPPVRFRWSHEAADGVKYHSKTGIVFLFKGIELFRHLVIGGDHLTQLYEGPHDEDIDLNGAFTAQNTGQHGDPLFGEGIGAVAPSASPL